MPKGLRNPMRRDHDMLTYDASNSMVKIETYRISGSNEVFDTNLKTRRVGRFLFAFLRSRHVCFSILSVWTRQRGGELEAGR